MSLGSSSSGCLFKSTYARGAVPQISGAPHVGAVSNKRSTYASSNDRKSCTDNCDCFKNPASYSRPLCDDEKMAALRRTLGRITRKGGIFIAAQPRFSFTLTCGNPIFHKLIQFFAQTTNNSENLQFTGFDLRDLRKRHSESIIKADALERCCKCSDNSERRAAPRANLMPLVFCYRCGFDGLIGTHSVLRQPGNRSFGVKVGSMALLRGTRSVLEPVQIRKPDS